MVNILEMVGGKGFDIALNGLPFTKEPGFIAGKETDFGLSGDDVMQVMEKLGKGPLIISDIVEYITFGKGTYDVNPADGRLILRVPKVFESEITLRLQQRFGLQQEQGIVSQPGIGPGSEV